VCVEALERHEELVRACSLCFPGGGNAPVVDVPKDVRVLLVAQAPGLTEVLTRLPFTGRRERGWKAGLRRRASRGLRSWSLSGGWRQGSCSGKGGSPRWSARPFVVMG
jgi:hypothetical protein